MFVDAVAGIASVSVLEVGVRSLADADADAR
jgi:hypothetical protein